MGLVKKYKNELDAYDKVTEAMNKFSVVPEYVKKWEQKMKGSPLSTAIEWIEGANLPTATDQKDVLKLIIRKKLVKMNKQEVDIKKHSWAKGLV